MMRPKLPKIGFLYLDYVLRFFDKSNFKGWPDKIEHVTYHWKNDKERFIAEVKRKKIEVLIGNIPATAYETFKEIAKALPNVRFVPSIETQFPNKSKENVTLFCNKHNISQPKTWIFYDKKEGFDFLQSATYPIIIKRSYGASNYGGYYVHYVRTHKEAVDIFTKEKYHPMYIQEALDLQGKDIRVMLIGHKPICAFWRVAGADMDITNTSQGGYIDYNNIPMSALELAVKASKAAKAEYWACDIAVVEGKPYILECATAFAAFPYVRDWIGQYLMWELSNGYFKKPNVPMFSWEELGKIDSRLLRRMRHLDFGAYVPSYDGDNLSEEFGMEKTLASEPSDMPLNPNADWREPKVEEQLAEPEEMEELEEQLQESELASMSLTKLLALHAMEEDMALEISRAIESGEVKNFDDLVKIEGIDSELISIWKESMKEITT